MALNILLVDDSETTRAVIVKTLQLSGLDLGEVLQAANGAEALEQLRAHWIDLVLTDINMPVMNGVELIDRMSAEGMLHGTPVVIVSTEGSQSRIAQLEAKGISAYVRKPFTPEIIRNVVDGILGSAAS